jgi:hypothetical protein
MEPIRSLTEIKRVSPEALLANLKSDSETASKEAGLKLLNTSRKYGLEMRDYLRLAIDPTKAENRDQYEGLNGYEAALCYLGLPVRDEFDSGVTLDLASDTFQTYTGTRAMFPQVIDDLVQWKYRQDLFERIDPLVASTRTISGIEMLTTVVDDAQGDYKAVQIVPELSNIPVKSIRTTEKSVKIWKIGGGYKTSYEFTRRARLDILTPYANRINRELEMSKVGAATDILINGDGVAAAAGVINQSSYNGGVIGTSTNGVLSYKHVLAWLVARAQAGVPVDTIVGNWDAYLQWLMLFALPTSGAVGPTAAENLAKMGFQVGAVPILQGKVNFALSSTASANQLIGYSRGETLEQLVEAGSLIAESERSVLNQSITYVKTETSGFRIVFPDTRSIFNFGA